MNTKLELHSLDDAELGIILERISQLSDEGMHFDVLDYAGIIITLARDDVTILAGFEYKAQAFDALGIPDLELHAYDAAIDRFQDSSLPEVSRAINWAYYNRAITLAGQGKSIEAVSSYDVAISRASKANDDDSRSLEAKAMFNRANLFFLKNELESASKGFSKLIEKFSSSEDPNLLEQVARARGSYGRLLLQQEKYQEAANELELFFALPKSALKLLPENVEGWAAISRLVAAAQIKPSRELARNLVELSRRYADSADDTAKMMAAYGFGHAITIYEGVGDYGEVRSVTAELLKAVEGKEGDLSVLAEECRRNLTRLEAQGLLPDTLVSAGDARAP